MSRQDYIKSLQDAIDALEAHVEQTKVFRGSAVEKTIKFQELMQIKSRAYNLMLEELDVLCREDMRKNKEIKIMSQEQRNELEERIKQDVARRRNES